MFRDIGRNDWLFDIDKATSAGITGAVMSIYRDYPMATVKVRKAMAFVQQQQAGTMTVVRKTLKI